MSIHQVIREGRRRLGLSEQQFADAVGVSRGAVQQWEKVGGTAPKRGNQPKVAELLGISLGELVSGEPLAATRVPTPAVVPLISEADVPAYADSDHADPRSETERQTVPVTVAVRRRTFALRVQGDSMMAATVDSFPDGAIIVVEPELDPRPGDFVVAITETRLTTFRQLVKDSGELFLKPLNPRYPIRPLAGSRLVGVVRELSKRFR